MTRPTPVAPEAELPERRASRTDFPRERLRDLLSIARVHEPVQVAIRREQHRELVRVAPRTQLFVILTVLLMGWELRTAVAPVGLIGWMAAIIAVTSARIVQMKMLKRRLEQPVLPNVLPQVTILIIVAALLWTVPSLLWSPMLPQHHQIMIGMVLLGLMCSGATSLGIVPIAALLFVVIIGAGQVRMTLYHDSVAVTLLAATIPLNMVQSILAAGRMFVRQIYARGELEEQGQLISLLREFQRAGASGCGSSMPISTFDTCRSAWPSRSDDPSRS
jgi:hypothetical protein